MYCNSWYTVCTWCIGLHIDWKKIYSPRLFAPTTLNHFVHFMVYWAKKRCIIRMHRSASMSMILTSKHIFSTGCTPKFSVIYYNFDLQNEPPQRTGLIPDILCMWYETLAKVYKWYTVLHLFLLLGCLKIVLQACKWYDAASRAPDLLQGLFILQQHGLFWLILNATDDLAVLSSAYSVQLCHCHAEIRNYC